MRLRTAALLAAAALISCGNDGPTGAPRPSEIAAAVPAPSPSSPPPSSPPSSTVAPTTTEPELEIPAGVLVAVPIQNREDPAKDQFQVQIHNGTRERYDVVGVQFVWAAYTTPVVGRDSIVVGGQVIDFPVPFPGANCAGDGTLATMPSIDDAAVVLSLEDGRQLELPVVDKWRLARKLYLEDCERQMIDSLVGIEWVDLHEQEFEGRPVTAGSLRLTRRAGEGAISVLAVGNTIPYVFDAVDARPGEPVVTLPAGAETAAAPVRFIESRCDPHALAEIKQPTKFVAQVKLGDGSVHPYIVYPERDLWTPMRLTADKACVLLGKVEFVGD